MKLNELFEAAHSEPHDMAAFARWALESPKTIHFQGADWERATESPYRRTLTYFSGEHAINIHFHKSKPISISYFDPDHRWNAEIVLDPREYVDRYFGNKPIEKDAAIKQLLHHLKDSHAHLEDREDVGKHSFEMIELKNVIDSLQKTGRAWPELKSIQKSMAHGS